MAEQFLNFIDGRWVRAKSGKTFENRNPANWSELVGTFPKSGAEDVVGAVAAAKKAQVIWGKTPAPLRGEIMRKIGDLMAKRKEEIARLMTREMGKVLKETLGDTQEGIDTAYYAAGEGRRLFGMNAPSELRNKVCLSFRRPIGVAGAITPWNFPMAIPTWKIFPAVLSGNAVVFKPASDTPATASRLVEIMSEAGIPDGVVNLVHGPGREVGEAILSHPDIGVVSFTGSSAIGRRIAEACGTSLKRCSLELGGKNAQIVMADADLELAIEGALWGAFGTTGQRCTATSRLILQKAIHDKFVKRFAERARALRLGDGLLPTTDVGPVISEQQRDSIHDYVKIGKREGAKLLLGGGPCTKGDCRNGWFYEPTIFTNVTPKMRIAKEEIFGPVVAIIKVDDLDEAVAVLNDTAYGLSSSIYTRDVNGAFRAVDNIKAGITYVNGPTIGAEAHMPFGGVKDTGNGHREGGWTVYDIFTEWQTVYVDYSGRLQKAQIDTEA
jgi:aldehyde dehydrogenase (NAD+)